MANVIPYAFRGELFSGNHNFASGGNTFKLALYTSATYDTASTVYVTTNEQSSASSSNYSAGGNTLTGNAVVSTTAVASCDFADSTWTSATISVSHGAIYNSSTTPANKVCVVLDFDGTKSCTNGTFTVSFPSPATAADAIISMA